MSQKLSKTRIDKIRSAARQIVRELGFMQKGLAQTNLSPSAVHTIIEVGYGTVTNASDLSTLLHLEKSSVSRLIQKLEKDRLIEIRLDASDRRSRFLSLTAGGKVLLGKVEDFARQQLCAALDAVPSNDLMQIEAGLIRFADALSNKNPSTLASEPEIDLIEGYTPGVVAAVTHLHASFYSKNYGFGSIFERKVATEMSEFMGRIDKPMNTIFSVYRGNDLLGSVSLDGEDLETGVGHLRWFIVSPQAQGLGIGTLLIEKITQFADQHSFTEARLWTFKGLDTARYLYEKQNFRLVRENPGSQWGKKVIEQEFVRKS